MAVAGFDWLLGQNWLLGQKWLPKSKSGWNRWFQRFQVSASLAGGPGGPQELEIGGAERRAAVRCGVQCSAVQCSVQCVAGLQKPGTAGTGGASHF